MDLAEGRNPISKCSSGLILLHSGLKPLLHGGGKWLDVWARESS
jgi:hypothetical protein